MRIDAEYFLRLRFDERTHLGLGDVRLTLGSQDEIIAELDALRADAERYRWLRARCDDCAVELSFAPSDAELGEGWITVTQNAGAGVELDAAIDAARGIVEKPSADEPK